MWHNSDPDTVAFPDDANRAPPSVVAVLFLRKQPVIARLLFDPWTAAPLSDVFIVNVQFKNVGDPWKQYAPPPRVTAVFPVMVHWVNVGELPPQ